MAAPLTPRQRARIGIGLTLITWVGITACITADDGSLEPGPVHLSVASSASDDPHLPLIKENPYPSASMCASCHPNIYDEWRSSAHAYASISPMFHRFEQTINELAQGTVGAFCVRCHIPVGTTLGQDRHMPLWERQEQSQTSIEGVTCVACHRVKEEYGRVNGQRRMEPGSIFEPVYAGTAGPGLAQVREDPEKYGVALGPDETGTKIHGAVEEFSALSQSQFCVSCHQVAVHPGIKLEVVWDQFLNSPAHAKGKSCQDCHMGATPGTWDDGYPTSYRALVNGIEIEPGSKHADHSFVGPGYSIAHPGIFPHRRQLDFTVKQWMTFDWRSDWGKDSFEATAPDPEQFPEDWRDQTARQIARQIVEENQTALDNRSHRRNEVMENGSNLAGPFFTDELATGEDLDFHYDVTNICEGHSFPSGSLGAQPEIWLNVALQDPDGKTIWESGDVDSHGDMRDLHSRDVREGNLPHDDQLFNLQTKFLTTNVKGTDREMYLPVNLDVDQIPFIRPAGVPTTVLNHPPFIRMEQRSIPPLRTREAHYSVPGELLRKKGTYRMGARLRSRAEPIYFMDFVGSTREMVHRMTERMIDIHPYVVEFEVK